MLLLTDDGVTLTERLKSVTDDRALPMIEMRDATGSSDGSRYDPLDLPVTEITNSDAEVDNNDGLALVRTEGVADDIMEIPESTRLESTGGELIFV